MQFTFLGTVHHSGESGQELKQKLWKNTDVLLVDTGSVSFFIQPRTTCPKNGAAHSGQGLFINSQAYMPMGSGQILNQGSTL